MRLSAHFCMSMADSEFWCAHNAGVDFRLAREVLRRARAQAATEREGVPRFGMTLDEAAEKSGLNRATIHSIENIKREPTLKPDLDTIERLVLAYGLTLSSFFARIESRARHGTGREDFQQKEGGAAGDHAVSAASQDTLDMDRELGRAIVRIVQRELTRRQIPGTGTGGAGGGPPHRKNR